ncbi:glycoside hydrolase family 13 protein [Lonsdalea populi]|uniref:glycoside hydrolase family 13 protein n=1 Tax=Lonsdalea populi TaxID=1172565 RepID=UPI000A252477|nr:alpha-glucosidase [Lonsdalea populi]OSM94301.1 glucohydrolase [Lonsdalea populi]RAT70717.1 glucohydrolase [Lonsdalea populi]RAT73250.1 glucohydrolase [Lonsdalea populi]RAT75371.1 glucohydrolase [Lonsdalea populi]RAT79090.1 glucohydrolase [Lonsdalea populi]
MSNLPMCLLAAAVSSVALAQSADAAEEKRKHEWWKEVVVYQIYPRSFNDSNGDGIGDLNGITEKLDYLKTLGVDVIWLSPHFDSPNADNGYDIRDYKKVMKEFGTMNDFDHMLSEMKRRDMRLIIDLVVNHTSDEHQWFKESRKSQDNPYRDYYIWRDGRNGEVPNNYPSFFGGSAWKKDNQTGQYYLHYFAEKQPDLNWKNQQVHQEVYDIMRFWLDKGVSGFRMDVIPFISKQPDMPDLSPAELAHPENVFATGPHIHQYLHEMNREVLAPYNAMSVGEAYGVTFEDTPKFVDTDRQELNMLFHFDVVRLDRDGWRKTDWTLPQLKTALAKIDRSGAGGWNTSFLGNHDNPRAVSHFGDDGDAWREVSAKALATLMLTQRATPFLYQGEELGMTNYPFTSEKDFEDVEIRGLWKALVEGGKVSSKAFLENVRQTSRDNARTPMQWSAAAQGGFTTGTPWLAVNPNYTKINAEAQVDDPHSVYGYHRRLIVLRRQTPALIHGEYRDLAPEHPDLFAYTRTLKDEQYLVAINFSRETQSWSLPAGQKIAQPVISNRPEVAASPGADRLTLQAWQAAIFKL